MQTATVSGAILEPAARTLSRVAAVAPQVAARAGAAITTATAPLAQTRWPEMATAFSRLTNTGYPVEFTWCSRHAELRWTAEVAPPEMPHRLRLEQALAVAGIELNVGQWLAAQQAGELRYGAWVGGRHRPDGDAWKVYLELPVGLPRSWRVAHPLLRSSLITWRMAGLGNDGSIEFYARCPELDARMLQAAEIGGSRSLLAAARALVGHDELPRPSGLSLALDPDGVPKALTWFVFAKAVFRNDVTCGSTLIGMASGDVERNLYKALAGGEADGRWRHAMLGVSLDCSGGVWMQAGIRPA